LLRLFCCRGHDWSFALLNVKQLTMLLIRKKFAILQNYFCFCMRNSNNFSEGGIFPGSVDRQLFLSVKQLTISLFLQKFAILQNHFCFCMRNTNNFSEGFILSGEIGHLLFFLKPIGVVFLPAPCVNTHAVGVKLGLPA